MITSQKTAAILKWQPFYFKYIFDLFYIEFTSLL